MDEPAGTGAMLDSGTSTHTNGAWEDITAGIPGFSGTAYRFNGTTSRVIVGDDPSLRPLSDTFTVSVMARFTTISDPNDPNNGDYDLIRKGVGSSKGGYWKLEIIPNSTRTAVRANCQMKGITSAGTSSAIKVTSDLSPLNDGNWHTLTCVKTDTTVTLTVDNELPHSKPVTIGSISNTVPLTLGAKPDADGNIGGDRYDGDLDEVSYQVGMPTISDFSPTSGPVGTSVTIDGTGLTRASVVRFNGASATFDVVSDTSLTAAVPSGATTGSISVTTPGGTATSTTSFTVTSSGTISQVQMAHGSAADLKITASFPSPPIAGDVLVAVVVVANSSNPGFDTPSGWTKPFTPVRGAVFWKVSNGSEQTITVNMAAGASPATIRMTVAELAGANTTNPFDQSGSSTFAQAVTSATPSGPTTQANEWAIAMVAQNGSNGGVAAPPTNGFSLLEGSTRDVSASNLSASGTVSTTISWMTARPGSWIIATFRPA